MITIYHNPRCTKSRDGVSILENTKIPFTIRRYLDEPFTKNELNEVLNKLNILPSQLVRTSETIWIKTFKGKQMTESEIFDALLLYPKLIERPIVVFEDKAVIGRPKERINELLKQF